MNSKKQILQVSMPSAPATRLPHPSPAPSKRKTINKLGLPVAFLVGLATTSFADVTVSDTEPSGTGVIAQSTAFGSTGSRIFDIDARTNHARGNRFIIPDGGGTTFRIDSVTIQSAGAQAFLNDTFTLYLYQGTSAQWNTGTGRVAGGDFYAGTTVTPVVSEAFSLSDDTIVNASYVTFALTTPIIVDEDDVYGFFLTYDQGDGALDNFFYRESGSPPVADDGRTSITDTAHGTATSRQINYWVQGEAIDPGITDSTLVPSDSLISTGDPIVLDITFDITVDTADLTTPGEVIDLLALDAGDENPGDGIVVVDQNPTATFTYEVDVTKAGQTSENVSAEVVVVDPSLVADNALSTAIKADLPVFYYRFEEPVDTGHVIDYSGNGNHTDDIVGPLVQGGSSGGVDNAARLNGDSGLRVPTNQPMNQAFTFTAVVDIDEFPAATLRNILSMSDGGTGTVGRSLLHARPSGLGTEISGGVFTLADQSVLFSETNCLIHMVSDPDADSDPATTGREVRIYVNGVHYTTTPVGNIAGNPGNWILGGNKTLTDEFYEGWIDETAIFDSVLSDSQITAHAAAFFPVADDPFLGFYGVPQEVILGESGEITFMISDQATSATIDGNSIDISAGAGAYSIPINPLVETTYNLVVSGPGGPFAHSVTVTVVDPPVEPRITSISIDDSTPPMVTLTMLGEPDTSYNLTASSTLVDDFPTPITTVLTDGSGVGTPEAFEGFGDAEFYRFETLDEE